MDNYLPHIEGFKKIIHIYVTYTTLSNHIKINDPSNHKHSIYFIY